VFAGSTCTARGAAGRQLAAAQGSGAGGGRDRATVSLPHGIGAAIPHEEWQWPGAPGRLRREPKAEQGCGSSWDDGLTPRSSENHTAYPVACQCFRLALGGSVRDSRRELLERFSRAPSPALIRHRGSLTRGNERPLSPGGLPPSELIRPTAPRPDPPQTIERRADLVSGVATRASWKSTASKAYLRNDGSCDSGCSSRQHRPGRAARAPFFVQIAGSSGHRPTSRRAGGRRLVEKQQNDR